MITDSDTKNVIIHNLVMVCITIFFIIYFGMVENSPELKKQIDDSIMAVPIGQFLAYEGYVGYVILKQIRRIQENKKIERTWLNGLTLGGRLIHEYVTQMVDLIGITIVTFSFFIYGYPNSSPNSFEIMNISNAYFLIFAPSLGIVSHKLLWKRKLNYT